MDDKKNLRRKLLELLEADEIQNLLQAPEIKAEADKIYDFLQNPEIKAEMARLEKNDRIRWKNSSLRQDLKNWMILICWLFVVTVVVGGLILWFKGELPW
jgi:hypothetical protein